MSKLVLYYIQLADRFSNGLTTEDYLQWEQLVNTKNSLIECFETNIPNYSFDEFIENEISSLSGKTNPDQELNEISSKYSLATRLEVLMFLIIDEQIELSYEMLKTIEQSIFQEKKENHSLLYKFIDLICQNEYCVYASEIERLLSILPEKYVDQTILLQVDAFQRNC